VFGEIPAGQYDDYLRSVNERNCRVLNTYEGDKGINNLLLNTKRD